MSVLPRELGFFALEAEPVWILILALGTARATPLADDLSSQLTSAMTVLDQRKDPPYYTAMQVEDRDEVHITASDGALAASNEDHTCYLDVDLRVGSPQLDNTHELRGFSSLESNDRQPVKLPLTDGPALNHVVWRELDHAYRAADERIVLVRANMNVKVAEETKAPDFDPVTHPVVADIAVPEIPIDRKKWESTIVDLSQQVERSTFVDSSTVSLHSTRVVKTFVDSAGSKISHGITRIRVSINVQATAPDGDVVNVFDSKDVHRPDELPSAAELHKWADSATTRLKALLAAPRGQPYSGPVILAGRAAGVFFHEVLGHRVEGQRQKEEDEGKTFADYVGKPILPDFIDVYDDPTIEHLAGDDLNGYYHYDDEGTPAQRAVLVDHGLFEGFLMSRSPIPGFPHSNGHGRRMAGHAPAARMGNTIVQADKSVPMSELRQMLIDEVKKQGLQYGILVEEIDGGFTLTGRTMPNAFNVRASASWRVYADGRPDQLVRGIDLVGTPLVAFHNLVAASDKQEVFNGHCGAESGWVPVSAVAPALLFKRLEFQLKEKGQERPPLLPKPPLNDGSADAGVDE